MTPALHTSTLSSLPLLARGKVRDNYAVGSDRILMVASDRISAFDVIMGEPIPGKGALLTQMALFWFDKLGPDGLIYNSVQLIDCHGHRLLNYRKTHLFGALDHSLFSPGPDAFPVIELNGWKVGMLICYDLEFPENTRRLALAGAQLIVVPTANMAPYDFIADVTVRSRAFENQCYVAYANYCGSESTIHYCGQSSIAAPDGQQVALAQRDETLISAVLDPQKLTDAQAGNSYLADRRPELYGALSAR